MTCLKVSYFTLIAFFLSVGIGKAQDTHMLKVNVTNVENIGDKKVWAGVYKKGMDFPKPGKHLTNKYTISSNESVAITFTLPGDEYAVAIYHDLDDNQILNTYWVGTPSEPYGFSKNFVPKLGSPDFEDCLIKLDGDKIIEIALLN